MTAWLSGAAVFGKAPWHDEFLRPPGKAGDLRLLDEWVFRNAGAMTVSLRAHGDQTPGPYGFVIQVNPSSDLQAVAGVLGPSRDSAGRAYPLVVAASLQFETGLGSSPQAIPILLDSYWQATIDVLASLGSAPLAPDDRSLEAATDSPFESAAAAWDLYRRWTEETTAADLCSLLDRPLDWLVSVAGRIATVARPAPGRVCAIRVPLGRAGGSAVCFWLDVIRRSSRSTSVRSQVPSFFWSHDGETGQAVVCLDPPGESALAALWPAGAPDGAVWDAVEDPGPHAAGGVDDAHEGGSLSTFLRRIESRSNPAV
jgi:type VI secretion system ImpM family protein